MRRVFNTCNIHKCHMFFWRLNLVGVIFKYVSKKLFQIKFCFPLAMPWFSSSFQSFIHFNLFSIGNVLQSRLETQTFWKKKITGPFAVFFEKIINFFLIRLKVHIRELSAIKLNIVYNSTDKFSIKS